jgi:modulator of drug activity B
LVDDGRSRQDPSRQYGTGGKMQGKQYMLSLTWNAPKEAFDDNNQVLFSGKSVDDVFIYNTVNYKFCGVVPVPSFSCFNVMKAPEISKDIERLKGHLASVFF